MNHEAQSTAVLVDSPAVFLCVVSQEDLPNKWALSDMENSSLGGISSGPTTLISRPTHSFIQEGRWAPTQKSQMGLGHGVVLWLFTPGASIDAI